MTYASAEASVQDSEPRERFVISVNDGATVYRHTSATRDTTYDGDYYTTIALDRGAVAITMPGELQDLTLRLPIDHPLVKRWPQLGVPPMKVELTVYRDNGGETRTIWYGEILSMRSRRGTAEFRVPSKVGEWMMRPIPALVASRSCPFFVGDTNCGVDMTGAGPTAVPHRVVTTVTYVNGRDVRVNLSTIPAADPLREGWCEGGRIKHVATGEWMTIHTQTDLNPGTSTVADLRMQLPIPGLKVGDSVEVYASCRLDITTCRVKFDNKQRFGGAPQMPLKNPFTPQGWGILDNV